MNFKRGKPKNARAGCLMCKSNKMNGYADERKLGHDGFDKLKRLAHSAADLKAFLRRKF